MAWVLVGVLAFWILAEWAGGLTSVLPSWLSTWDTLYASSSAFGPVYAVLGVLVVLVGLVDAGDVALARGVAVRQWVEPAGARHHR